MRGGHVRVPMVKPPDNREWTNVTKTFETAIQLESEVKEVCMNFFDNRVDYKISLINSVLCKIQDDFSDSLN